MKNITKFKKQLILLGIVYVLAMALLVALIGDSYLLAIVAIAGWALLFAGVMRYIALKKNSRSAPPDEGR
jgi:hypothetical protein